VAWVLALSGFMGSGKSAVGRRVARLLGWRFLDLDQEIERRLGTTIQRLFRTAGEPGFREAESEVLASVLRETADATLVLALGGGTVTIPGAAEAVRRSGVIVFLDLDPGSAWERVRGSGRPLATSRDAFVALAVERGPVYRSTADAVVTVAGRSEQELAEETVRVAGCLPGWPGPGVGDGAYPGEEGRGV
jgi:shikimate kinase